MSNQRRDKIIYEIQKRRPPGMHFMDVEVAADWIIKLQDKVRELSLRVAEHDAGARPRWHDDPDYGLSEEDE